MLDPVSITLPPRQTRRYRAIEPPLMIRLHRADLLCARTTSSPPPSRPSAPAQHVIYSWGRPIEKKFQGELH